METANEHTNGMGTTEFKSYYVVWKLNKYMEAEKKRLGLNRTM